MNYKNLTSGLHDRKTLWLIILSSILLTIVIQVLLYLKGFYSISADESGRTLLAYDWLNGNSHPGEPWLPFYTIINAAALKIHFDLFWTPRIVGSFFGVLSTAAIIWCSHELFQDKQVTILTSIFSVFFPLLVIIKAVPLTETMFIFFIAAGSGFFARWLYKEKSFYLLMTALFFALSSIVRYEGWIFSFCLFVYLLYNYKKIGGGKISLYSIILATFPIYWILLNAIETGDPLGFIIATSGRYKFRHNTWLDLLKYNLITQFIARNIIYLNFGGIVSLLILSFINEKIQKWIFIPLVSFIIMAILSFAKIGMPSHAFWRIPLIWNVLLFPFTAYFVIKLAEFLSEVYQKRKIVFITLISLIIVSYFSFQIWRLSNDSFFTEDDLNAGRYLKEKIHNGKSDFKILIDSSEWIYLNIFIASEYPDEFLLNSGQDPSQPEKPVINQNKGIDLSYLKQNKIKYLLFKRMDYKDFLDRRNEIEKIKTFGEWKLYKVLFLN